MHRVPGEGKVDGCVGGGGEKGNTYGALDVWSSFVLRVLVDVGSDSEAVGCRCCAMLVAGKSEKPK